MSKLPPQQPGVPPQIQAMIDATKKRAVSLEMTNESVLVDSESASVFFTGRHKLMVDPVTVRVPFSALLIAAMNVTGAVVIPMVQGAERVNRKEVQSGPKLVSE